MRMTSDPIPVIDIFAGPGGLGEGFSRCVIDGRRSFRVKLSIEKESSAHRTLRLRSLYRSILESGEHLDGYYESLEHGGNWETIRSQYPVLAEQAEKEAWCAELGKTAAGDVDRRISAAIRGKEDRWVLIGGPPCQAYSLVGRSRRHKMKTYSAEKDERTQLYKEYLKIIANHWPAVFVMENVKGLLSHRVLEERIFDRIVGDLQDPAAATSTRRRGRRYSYDIVSLVRPDDNAADDPFKFVVHSEQFGVPQARHRVILLGIRSDLGSRRPTPLTTQPEVACARVLSGLPPLRSGLSKGGDSAKRWGEVLRSALSEPWFEKIRANGGGKVAKAIREAVKNVGDFEYDRGGLYLVHQGSVAYAAEWFMEKHRGCVLNHETRGHMETDLQRYLFASCFAKSTGRSPKLGDFPQDLLPKHENVEGDLDEVPFADRFRVQVSSRPSTTVTSHISKDGHYYIHPDPSQCRSLTVREAARLQTFPDSYFFTGNRTEQYVQVGNAVPPLLARSIAEKVREVLGNG